MTGGYDLAALNGRGQEKCDQVAWAIAVAQRLRNDIREDGGATLGGITDFVALDVETANADFASICSIGLVHFRGGAVFKTLTVLVDPEDEFDPINIGIHGIRPEDVAGKPTMAKVFPIIGAALQDTAIVHHSPFDRTALARAADRYGTGGLPCFWLDTLQVARRTWDFKNNGGYGLANLASAFGIQFRHHDAAEDARAAGLILLRAVSDGGITLQQWVDDHGYVSTNSTAPTRIKRPVYPNSKVARRGDGDGPLLGETVVFTGELEIARESAALQASTAGADVANSVTRKTTILVVGNQNLRLTHGQEKSSKHRKAEAMIAEGAAIRIVGESDFVLMVAN